MATFAAVFDACVFYPAPLRDLLMQLALTDLFRARWTSAIHDEWLAAVTKDRPDLNTNRLQRTKERMDSHIRDCLVSGFEPLIESLHLPDPDDRHVLAAAIRCHASVIVTYNLKDFPADVLTVFDIEAQHPDDFVAGLIDLAPAQVIAAVRTIRARLRSPPMTAERYLDNLAKRELVETVSMLRAYEAVI